jgi:hypothetical protein
MLAVPVKLMSKSNSSMPAICSARHTPRADGRSRTILFGGDLGRFAGLSCPNPSTIPEADYLLVESDLWQRVHDQDDNGTQLAAVNQQHGGARRPDHHLRRSRLDASRSSFTG